MSQSPDVEKSLSRFQFMLIALAGWMDRQQQHVIEYLREESRVLREQLGNRHLRFNDDQRRRLAARAKGLGRKLLMDIATLVTPVMLPAWHRKLIAQKYDGSASGKPGRPVAKKKLAAGVTAGCKVRWPIWGLNAPVARFPLSCGGTGSNQRPNEIEKRRGKSSSTGIGN